jgi:hypothetical protein
MKLNVNVFDPYNQMNTFDKVYDIPAYPTDEQSQWYWAQRVRADMPISVRITWGDMDFLMDMFAEFARTQHGCRIGWLTCTDVTNWG